LTSPADATDTPKRWFVPSPTAVHDAVDARPLAPPWYTYALPVPLLLLYAPMTTSE
jgi:hypothetical protein